MPAIYRSSFLLMQAGEGITRIINLARRLERKIAGGTGTCQNGKVLPVLVPPEQACSDGQQIRKS